MRKLKYTKTILSAALAVILLLSFLPAGFWGQSLILQAEADAPITLRVCNWEEYIDLGDWMKRRRSNCHQGISSERTPW